MSLPSGEPETAFVGGSVDPASRPSCMIVEDQILIALALEASLEDLGIAVGRPISSASEALEWLDAHTPSVAILDYALKDGPCTTLIRRLAERRIPFVIYSGHNRSVAPRKLQNVPWLTKPCDWEVLLAALTRAAPALAAWKGSRDGGEDLPLRR